MIARVEKVKSGFALLIPPEMGDLWRLYDGAPVEVHRVGSTSEADTPEAIQAGIDRSLRIFRETLHQYDRVYRELAKGVGAPADD